MTCDDGLDPERLARDSLLFRRRVVELAPDQLVRIGSAWRDAVVFLTAGEIELECVRGERRRFGSGAILCLAPPVSLLRNSGGVPARLIAISRRRSQTQKRTG